MTFVAAVLTDGRYGNTGDEYTASSSTFEERWGTRL